MDNLSFLYRRFLRRWNPGFGNLRLRFADRGRRDDKLRQVGQTVKLRSLEIGDRPFF
ncbi:hypothetical protein CKA32_003684 [Geitlerinema sp. FC II]|nr:hypothetical protein CKA32_003684 [Geitlerinema sp. FC II]